MSKKKQSNFLNKALLIVILIVLVCVAVMNDNDKKKVISSINSFRNQIHDYIQETIKNKTK